MLLCAAAGAVFFGTEVYLPLLLHDRYGLPAWLSGITLTAAAVAWALASAIQGRLGDRLDEAKALRIGAVLLAGGTVVVLLTAALGLPAVLAAVGWFFAGGRHGHHVSAGQHAGPGPVRAGRGGLQQRRRRASRTRSGASVSLALAGLIFAGLGDTTTRTPYVGVLVLHQRDRPGRGGRGRAGGQSLSPAATFSRWSSDSCMPLSMPELMCMSRSSWLTCSTSIS